MYNEWEDPIKEALNKPEPKLKEVAQKTSEEKLTDINLESNRDHLSVGNTGLESIEQGAERIHVDDKAIINCRADLNQLVPFKYEWAWKKYLDGSANHWMPEEIAMHDDIKLWNDPNGLTED